MEILKEKLKTDKEFPIDQNQLLNVVVRFTYYKDKELV